jgi:hypothetical protein
VARRVTDGPRVHFVVHFDTKEDVSRNVLLADATGLGARPLLDGVVVIQGPPGSGRADRARAAHAAAGRHTLEELPLDETDAATWDTVEEQLAGGVDVLLRRAEAVPEGVAPDLVGLVARHQRAREAGLRSSVLMLTAFPDELPAASLPALSGGSVLYTQALAANPDRIPAIVRGVLDRVDVDGRRTMSPAALQALMRWSWPGNLTELVDTVTGLVRDVPGPVIERRHLPARIRDASPRRQLTLIEEAERSAIVRALQECAGNKSEAATLLGIGRTTLYRRLKQLGLDPDEGLV